MTELQLDLGFADDSVDDDWFDTLVAINQRWLGSYACLNPSFGVSPSLMERSSLWMNTHFQKQRMLTSPVSKQAKALLAHHQKTVLARLRSGGAGGTTHNETETSTALVEPIAALVYAASADRCPEQQIESLLTEALELLRSRSLRNQALCSGFASCVFRFLTSYTEPTKRILTLQLLVLLASDDAQAVVHACKIAAQGQLWQPNMFIYTLQKRHYDNEIICDLAAKLLTLFSNEMPIASPIKMNSARQESDENSPEHSHVWNPPPSRLDPSPVKRTHTLPAIASNTTKKSGVSPHRPTTTISSLYVGIPSPYSSDVILPIARPPPSAAEQTRRSQIYSIPKEKAIAGDYKRHCPTPNIVDMKREPTSTAEDLNWMEKSPPKSPTSPRMEKKPIVFSEKYSWNPDCINSVSGFEWWWRSLPQHHTNLEPTQKLKMVTKAAVRLHTKGEWERAVELYLLALSMNVNDEVAFRLRVNLGCAYEVGKDFSASEASFRAALLINRDDPYARFKLGSALKELERFDEAAVAYEAVLEAYPQAKSALEQLEEARQAKIKREEAERAALASARTARSPSKPGRRLHSRGKNDLSSHTNVPSHAESPCDVAELQSGVNGAVSVATTAKPIDSPESLELVSWIEDKCNEHKVDLRATLRTIDSESTGHIRLVALVKLLSTLCGVDENTIIGRLPHEAVQVHARDIVQYDVLLDALDNDAKMRRTRDPDHSRQWVNFVDALSRQEAAFYSDVRSRNEVHAKTSIDDPRRQDFQLETPHGLDSVDPNDRHAHYESSPRGSGPLEHGLAVTEPNVTIQSSSTASNLSIEIHSRSAADEMDGYHSVTARLDAKREKARQETILRAERARVVARKHMHCVKALQDIAVRARRYLIEQHEEHKRQLLQSEQSSVVDPSEHPIDPSLSLTKTNSNPDTSQSDAPLGVDPSLHTMDGDVGAFDSVDPANTEETDGSVTDIDSKTLELHHCSPPPKGCAQESDQVILNSSGNPISSLGADLVDGVLAAATRRVVIAAGVAELQAVAQSFACTVSKTLQQLNIHVAAMQWGSDDDVVER